MIIKTSAFSLSVALFAGVAAAQTLSGPTANGRQLQPTEQQFESRRGNRARCSRTCRLLPRNSAASHSRLIWPPARPNWKRSSA
jgi:hypothetical protein